MNKLLTICVPFFAITQQQPISLEEWLVESHAPLAVQEESPQIAEEKDFSENPEEKPLEQKEKDPRPPRERALRAKTEREPHPLKRVE